MSTPLTSIMRQSTRQPLEPLNILTFPTHERYETGLASTGHTFYAYRSEGIKNWNTTYAQIPSNYILLDENKGMNQIPSHVEFDLVLSQNRFAHYKIARHISQKYHIPLMTLTHVLPHPSWNNAQLEQLRDMKGVYNVYITNYSLKEWHVDPNDESIVVIPHMVDSDVFKPNEEIERQPYILSINNDFVNRGWCLNFNGWQRITKGLPVRLRGDTPGLSTATTSVEELVNEYQNAQVFLNTSTISPLPTVMIEAMSMGCAVVSTDTCEIPNIIDHGKNGLISNNESKLREYCKMLLNDPDLCKELGENARQTILSSFSKEQFLQRWNTVFRKTANTPYLGS